MTNEQKKYAGVIVNVSKPFMDKETSEKSIVIRYHLEKMGSNELCFCDIQFPQEIVINNHNMLDYEVEAMMMHYEKYSKEMWTIAEGLPDFNDIQEPFVGD